MLLVLFFQRMEATSVEAMGTDLAFGETYCADKRFQFAEFQGIQIQAFGNLFYHASVLGAVCDGII